MGFSIPDHLRVSLTKAGSDAILTILDDDAIDGAFDRLTRPA